MRLVTSTQFNMMFHKQTNHLPTPMDAPIVRQKRWGYFLACVLLFRVTRRGENSLQVVGTSSNRPLAKHTMTPAMCDRDDPAKINPKDILINLFEKTGAKIQKGFLRMLSYSLKGLN